MGKGKLEKFEEIKEFWNVLEPTMEEVRGGAHPLKGKWNSEFFENNGPLVLELGCGKGEYSLALGRKHRDKNFLGVDIKGNRIWKGAKDALEAGMDNVAFIRSHIDFIQYFFEKEEVDEIWLTFSDPQPKDRWAKKRLTAPKFLEQYKRVLKPNGLIHLKTDNDILFQYTIEQIAENGHEELISTWDVHGEMGKFEPESQEILSEITFYEQLALDEGKKIKYVQFRLNS